jgi:hypothetical protein
LRLLGCVRLRCMADSLGPINLELPKRPLGVQGLSLYETLTKSLLVSVSFLRCLPLC